MHRQRRWRASLVALLLVGCGPGTGADGSDGGDDTTTQSPPFDPWTCGAWTEIEMATSPSFDGPEPTCEPGGACVRFIDATQQSGLDHVHYAPVSPDTSTCWYSRNEVPGTDCELQWFSAGVAVGDVDDDGWPDLFFPRLGAPDVLYRNRGDGTFENISARAGFDACTFTNGAAFGDVDADGDQDLFVTALGGDQHFLYINDGTGTFTDEASARGAALPAGRPLGGQSAQFGDYDLDGDLDLYVAEWLRERYTDAPLERPLGARLLRNDGTGHFDDVTEMAGVSLEGRDPDGVFAFSSTFVDLDEDGWPELAVAADFQTSALFWNRGDGTFQDGTSFAGVNDESNAMGSTFGDYDGDGKLDWFVTSIAQRPSCVGSTCGWLGTGNRLYRNRGTRRFDEFSEALDLRDAGWGWGTAFFDVDLDGDLDLFATNGWPGPDLEGGRLHVAFPNRLWIANEGAFVDQAAASGVADQGQGRGLAVVDYDRDGDLDLVIARHAQPPLLLRNDTANGRHWISVRVRGGAGSHPEARGAVVRLWPDSGDPAQIRHVGVDAHFLGGSDLPVHFGLGDDDQVARIEVHWPASGKTLELTDVSADAQIEVRESDAP